MTSGTADCIEEISTPNKQQSPRAAECEPEAGTGSPEAQDTGMEKVQDVEIKEAVAPQQAMVMVVVSAPSWAQPIREFPVDGVLPEEEAESREIGRRSWAYTIINNEMVRKIAIG